MPEAYGILVFAGLCVFLAVWLHAQQARARPPAAGGRESTALDRRLVAERAAPELSPAELREIAGRAGCRAFRPGDEAPPPPLAAGPRQSSLWLPPAPGAELVLTLNVEFAPPPPAAAVCALLEEHGLERADDGVYRKIYAGRGLRMPLFYAANDTADGRFRREAAGPARGVCFFMSLPTPADGLQVFNGMLRLAEDLCEALEGALLDEARRPLTRAGTEALLERVEEFAARRSSLDEAPLH